MAMKTNFYITALDAISVRLIPPMKTLLANLSTPHDRWCFPAFKKKTELEKRRSSFLLWRLAWNLVRF